jgi:hypothetical protein
MAADAWVIHNNFKEYMGDGTVDLDDDAFRMTLHDNSGSLGPIDDPDTNAFADNDDELGTANGYTANGELVAATWVLVTTTVTFDVADGVWTAALGSIVARFAAIFDDQVTTPVVDPVVCHSLLDNTPLDVTATDGNTLTVQVNSSGVFTLT